MLTFTPRQAAIKVHDLLVIEYGHEYDVENIILLNKTRARDQGYANAPTICWDQGPEDWALHFSLRDEVLKIKGVYIAPYDRYTLCFHEEGSNDVY